MDKIWKHYLPVFEEATKGGFTGSEQDYTNVVQYMQRVQESQLEHDKKVSKLWKLDDTLQRKSFRPTPRPKPIVKPVTFELPWLKALRDRVDAVLNKREVELPEQMLETPLYSEIKSRREKLDKQVDALRKPAKDLFPSLSPEAVQKVKQAMGPGNAELVNAFNVTIRQHDIQTLRPGTWLNDEVDTLTQVINFYGELCMKRAKENPDIYPKIHVFNTFFYEKLSTKGYDGVRRWSRKFDIFALNYVIIPVHLGMHWCCAVINFKLKRLEYYDSLYGKNFKCTQLLREYLQKESMDKKKQPYDTTAWIDYIPQDIPGQENGYDCGVFTCMFMEFVSREEEFLFTQAKMPYLRQRIAHEIMSVQLMAT